MPCETAVPMAGAACTRAHARDYAGGVAVGSEGGQGQEFLGVRECVCPETRERAFSRPFTNGRKDVVASRLKKRTPRREEAANVLSSLVQLQLEGERGKGGGKVILDR